MKQFEGYKCGYCKKPLREDKPRRTCGDPECLRRYSRTRRVRSFRKTRGLKLADRLLNNQRPFLVSGSHGGHPCLDWTGALNNAGTGRAYGMVQFDGKLLLAHRASYQEFNNEGKPIPPGLQIIHTCERDICIQPNHLEAVSASERAIKCIERLNHPSKRYDIGPEQEEEMRERHWVGGEGNKAIGEDYGLSHETVRVIVNGTRPGDSPLSPRHAQARERYVPRRAIPHTKRYDIGPQQVEEIRERHWIGGETYKAIAQDYKLSRETIRIICNGTRIGDPPLSPRHAQARQSFRPHRERKLTKEQAREVRNSNEPQSVLAKRYGVTRGTISKIKRHERYRDVE